MTVSAVLWYLAAGLPAMALMTRLGWFGPGVWEEGMHPTGRLLLFALIWALWPLGALLLVLAGLRALREALQRPRGRQRARATREWTMRRDREGV